MTWNLVDSLQKIKVLELCGLDRVETCLLCFSDSQVQFSGVNIKAVFFKATCSSVNLVTMLQHVSIQHIIEWFSLVVCHCQLVGAEWQLQP
jgi:hypothetical protein